MKILILGTAHPFRGGLAAYNERLALQFISEGVPAEIFTFTLQYPRIFFPGKTQFTDAEAPARLKITRLFSSVNPFTWVKTGFRIRKMKPDILIIKYWHPFMAPCFGTIIRIAARGKNRKTKVICIFDNVIPHEKSIIDRMLTSYFTAGIDGAIVMSRSVAEDLSKFRVNLPVRFNPHPLYDNYGSLLSREESLRRLSLDEGNRYLLFFGFIRAYKGLDLLIDAFADPRLRGKNLKLIVAGEFYEDAAPYLLQVKKHHLDDDIIFYDRFIKEEEVSLFFSACDLVVQPYRSATQSGVTQIAYHFEKPMVVTDVGGLSEIVPHSRCGYVVAPEPETIAGSINDFFSSGRKTSLVAGVREEKAKFTWDKLTEAIMKVYYETDN